MSIVDAWYRKSAWLWLLWPLSVLFTLLARQRRSRLEKSRGNAAAAPPVIVVGNITVGGTGKSPFVIALVKLLQANGIRPAIITRGYGGNAPCYPFKVTETSSVEEAGDEAVMIGRSVSCPVLVDAKRVRAVEKLRQENSCDVIISDDGLQHYAMARALEIVLIDGERLLGNGLCLPAGPLREPPSRLQEVDHVVVNGIEKDADITLAGIERTSMQLRPTGWVNLRSGEQVALPDLPLTSTGLVHAIAGIGNPQRFFRTVQSLGYAPLCHPFPDHYRFTAQDLRFAAGHTVVMTYKDAVKCKSFAEADCWYLAIDAELTEEFRQRLLTDIRERIATAKANRREI
ncbi:MAG: tetraacyldisaccharide 4'-kinase [Gammaproteobacteria bacterium RIFCSPLOWO2_02_FULL_57_10]|nr:MAG: tetraacyldisaccharide 4'-kinase [Gammaproteobacteria bacterium RIFCSPLOWO2_02_FULL_57_10]